MQQQELFERIFPGVQENQRDAFLLDITERYPYFLPAEYFLLRERGGAIKAPFLAAKVALGFNSPFLLQQRLLDDNVIDKQDFQSSKTAILNPFPADQPQDAASPVSSEVVPAAEEIKINLPEMKGEPLGELTFEPLHTSDYFASQGIKLSEEMLASDKLGNQMKSFTSWLKTMKRVGYTKQSAPLDKKVEEIAENSNKEEDVITASMAEVYENQGKYAKAREIYLKLSLLNPSKSAYFAAKLEKIKDY